MTTCRVMLCCNDDRGDFAERVEAVEIGDEIRLVGPSRVLRFEGVGPAMRVRVGRRKYPCRGHAVWVGNIFWDATSMSLEVARELVSYLLANGWTVEEYAEDGRFTDLARNAA